MHGNIPFSKNAKVYTDILKVLAEDTWGFTYSLQDYANNAMEIMEKEIKQSTRQNKGLDTLAYREL
jgi:hypothetical protein